LKWAPDYYTVNATAIPIIIATEKGLLKIYLFFFYNKTLDNSMHQKKEPSFQNTPRAFH
jgi:hypothetical protein